MQIVWFRRDLRVEDNAALSRALETGDSVVAIYFATPTSWRQHNLSERQADLIYRRLCQLQMDLSSLNIPLFYAEVDTFQSSAQTIANIALDSGAAGIHLNKEYEVNERRRDAMLDEILVNSECCVNHHDDKCIFPPGQILNKQGAYFKVFTPFKRAYLSKLYEHSFVVHRAQTASETASLSTDLASIFSQQCVFSYPRKSSEEYPVDTNSIIRRLRTFDAELVENYHHQRDIPSIEATSRLSPYLAIGALSVRQCMARLLYHRHTPLTGGREVWQSELIWREFYQHLLWFESKLSKGKSFVPWGDAINWRNDANLIQAWKSGNTGYPIVDAAMRQLNQTGWMHNRLRMVVASFLVKDLHVDWRIGEAYFMSMLVDGDYAANNGGWQWCASTGCDGQPYFRIFNPVSQGEKFDRDGVFVRRWVPEIAQVPDKFIHKPWLWPEHRCLKYPQPVVDHKVAREITLQVYKEAKEVRDVEET